MMAVWLSQPAYLESAGVSTDWEYTRVEEMSSDGLENGMPQDGESRSYRLSTATLVEMKC